MRLLLVVDTELYPFDLVHYNCREYDEIILPKGIGLYELSEFYADSMQKSVHTLFPKRGLNDNEKATEIWIRDMVEHADAVFIVYNEESDEIKAMIAYAQDLGKKIDVIRI